MTDRDYAIKSMKEITFQMASHAQDYLEVTIERHYTDIKELMTSYQKLILENQIVLEELDMECQEKINEDMAYALSYLSIYNSQLNVPKMHREMNNLMIIYGLSDMIYRGMTLVKFYSERLITEEEYIQFSRIYSNEIENIKSRLDTVLAAQVRYSQDYHIEEGWGNVIHTYMSKRKLTKEMADAFVDSIIIHGKYDYEIKLVYDDQFADLQKLKKEKEAQSR